MTRENSFFCNLARAPKQLALSDLQEVSQCLLPGSQSPLSIVKTVPNSHQSSHQSQI